jgi:hypothetical protein
MLSPARKDIALKKVDFFVNDVERMGKIGAISRINATRRGLNFVPPAPPDPEPWVKSSPRRQHTKKNRDKNLDKC